MDRLLAPKPRLADPTRTDIPEIQTDPRENPILSMFGKWLATPFYMALANVTRNLGTVPPRELLELGMFASPGIAQIKAFHGSASPEPLSIPLWTERFKGLTKRIRDMRERNQPLERIKFPEWKQLDVQEQRQLLEAGYVIDVDRMGNPILGVSRKAREDLLRKRVMEKRRGKQ